MIMITFIDGFGNFSSDPAACRSDGNFKRKVGKLILTTVAGFVT